MMLGMSRSIFRRLLFSYLITVLVGIGVAGVLMSFFAKEYFYEAKQEELLRKAKKVNVAIQDRARIDDGIVEGIDEGTIDDLVLLDETFDTRIWVFKRDGEIIATSMQEEVFIGKSVASSIVKKVVQGQDVITELQFEGLEDPMLSVAVPWGKKDEVYGGIVLHAPIEGIERTIDQMRETILWATLFGLVLSTAMVSYLSWSISRPLKKIERTATEIGRGNYRERVHVSTTDEIADLAHTINTLADKLEKMEQERRSLEQVRNDFLANLSHELRTPLTGMQGFLEALQDGLVEEEAARQKYYNVLYNETMHLNRLVDDLLDLMKLENNEITLSRFPVDPAEMIQKIAFTFRQEAAEKGTTIEVETADDLPKIYADKDRLEQILNNLVKNAVKFTEQGVIRLTAAADGEWVVITVADTGIGISQDDLDRIWERFFKVDRGRSKKNAGTGLGLAIVKQLVELHEGSITVESEPEKGTVFTLRMPTVERYRQGT